MTATLCNIAVPFTAGTVKLLRQSCRKRICFAAAAATVGRDNYRISDMYDIQGKFTACYRPESRLAHTSAQQMCRRPGSRVQSFELVLKLILLHTMQTTWLKVLSLASRQLRPLSNHVQAMKHQQSGCFWATSRHPLSCSRCTTACGCAALPQLRCLGSADGGRTSSAAVAIVLQCSPIHSVYDCCHLAMHKHESCWHAVHRDWPACAAPAHGRRRGRVGSATCYRAA